jgi:hypothetical protein
MQGRWSEHPCRHHYTGHRRFGESFTIKEILFCFSYQ